MVCYHYFFGRSVMQGQINKVGREYVRNRLPYFLRIIFVAQSHFHLLPQLCQALINSRVQVSHIPVTQLSQTDLFLNKIKCRFLRGGENRGTRGKTSQSRVENQQTQPTYDTESRNQTRPIVTQLAGKCSHCATPALQYDYLGCISRVLVNGLFPLRSLLCC